MNSSLHLCSETILILILDIGFVCDEFSCIWVLNVIELDVILKAFIQIWISMIIIFKKFQVCKLQIASKNSSKD